LALKAIISIPHGQLFKELHNIEVAIIEQEIDQLSQSNPTAIAHKKESTMRQGVGRQVLLANFPRIDHLHDLAEDQCQWKKCGFQLVNSGEEII
jgi:hypothetical protein